MLKESRRYQMPFLLIIGLAITILSATAFVVVLSNEHAQQQSSQRLTTTTTKATVTTTTMMNRDRRVMDGGIAGSNNDVVDNDDDIVENETMKKCDETTISMAFCGNSMLYFNDSPRLLELIITIVRNTGNINGSGGIPPMRVIQDSCLRGGATLSSLYEHGNGMMNKFKTPPAMVQLPDILSIVSGMFPATARNDNDAIHSTTCNTNNNKNDDDGNNIEDDDDNHDDKVTNIKKQKIDSTSSKASSSQDHISQYDIGSHTVQQMIQQRKHWDYIILNDYTQGPARLQSRKQTQHVLRSKYVPLIRSNDEMATTTTTVIVIQTPAYQKEHLKDSSDLGTFLHFTNLLADGVAEYVQTIKDAGIQNVNVAPVGEAYRYLYNTNQTLWNKLYSWDHFHPSPYGTYLQICVLYCTMFHECLPINIYDDTYWLYSRVMQPIDEAPLPKPTVEEANELRRVACLVTGVKIEMRGGFDDRIDNDDDDDDKEGDDDDKHNVNDDEIDRSSG